MKEREKETETKKERGKERDRVNRREGTWRRRTVQVVNS